MYKKIKLILIVIIISILSYKVVINKDSLKQNFSWVFESEEEMNALPELSNEEIEKNRSKNQDLAKDIAPKAPVKIEKKQESAENEQGIVEKIKENAEEIAKNAENDEKVAEKLEKTLKGAKN